MKLFPGQFPLHLRDFEGSISSVAFLHGHLHKLGMR